jgi:hypothetical protein
MFDGRLQAARRGDRVVREGATGLVPRCAELVRCAGIWITRGAWRSALERLVAARRAAASWRKSAERWLAIVIAM